MTLQVGNGPDQAAVPPLNGKTVAEAGPLLTERGLLLGAQTEQNTSDATQVGKILSSTPAAGENVAAGTPVAVVIGKQQTTVAVPNVVGQDADDARNELEDAGFTVKSTSVDGGNDGEVASTDPAAGTQAPQKSTVTLRVFNGDTSKTDMPDVRGRRIDQAQATLAGRGLLQHPGAAREPRIARARTAGCSTSRRRRARARLHGRPGHARRRAVRRAAAAAARPRPPAGTDAPRGPPRRLRSDRVRVLVVDNYDSFVYNLVQYLAQLGADTTVRRNDEVDLDELDDVDGVLISPGPGTPSARARAST